MDRERRALAVTPLPFGEKLLGEKKLPTDNAHKPTAVAPSLMVLGQVRANQTRAEFKRIFSSDLR